MAWLDALKKGLNKTAQKIGIGFNWTTLDDEALQDIEDVLISSDMGLNVVNDLMKSLKKSHPQTPIEAKKILADEIEKILTPVAKEIPLSAPDVFLMIGVNGAGKTTTVGKMGASFSEQGYKVSFGAIDTFRAGAIEQLKVWAQKINCPIFHKEQGADPAGCAYDAVNLGLKRGDDVIFLDTAGRLQNRSDLMAELQKIGRVLKKIDEKFPTQTILVLDGTVGQNAISQVKVFSEILPISGLIMTKLDGSAKGGILLALAKEFALPIYAIGVGEGVDDLHSFNPKDYAEKLLGI